MDECFRVLKPGGKALFSVPLDEKLEQTWNPPPGTSQAEIERICGRLHVRLYGQDFPDLLRSHGFEVSEVAIDDDDDAQHRLYSKGVDKVFEAVRPAEG
jgi:SAM-dependent methyltransferase